MNIKSQEGWGFDDKFQFPRKLFKNTFIVGFSHVRAEIWGNAFSNTLVHLCKGDVEWESNSSEMTNGRVIQ